MPQARTATNTSMPFTVQDQPQNEVVCPLTNSDGSNCRKRCFGEKRYRSMQEHIRRAHPEHYLPKLPATEESFRLMINTPPHAVPERAPLSTNNNDSNHAYTQPSANFADNSTFYNHSPLSPHTARDPRRSSLLPAASAAAALAQLHQSRPGNEWETQDHQPQPNFADTESNLHNYFASQDAHMLFHDADATMNNLLAGGSRAGSLQPFPRKPNRPRKSSVTENARKPQHERQRSKDKKRFSHDRKGYSQEPLGIGSKRWEDLLDAAASATEEDSRDLTPIRQIPQSPRGSMPPHSQSHNPYQSYNTSPLQNAILPQSPEQEHAFEPPPIEAFPSVESTFDNANAQNSFHQHQNSTDSSASNTYGYSRHQPGASGSNFHIPAEGLSSPNDHSAAIAHIRSLSGGGQAFGAAQAQQAQQQPTPPAVQHYCAACHHAAALNSSYACTECICGICRDCVDVLINMPPDRAARCPRCGAVGGKFKPFLLDLR